jgi:ubiquinone/menaquinone biosynthesis C-methylase UbiE
MAEPAHSFDDSAAYERFMGRWSRAAGELFLAWLTPPKGARWLDVGCGTGVFTALIADRCAPQAVTAVDPAPAQIAHARRQPLAQRVDFQVADAASLPFGDAAFDVAALALVLNFVPDRPRALAEISRVTRPGSVVAGYAWDFAAELSPSWPLRRGLREVGLDVPDVPGTASSRLDALRSLFEQAGFVQIDTNAFDVTLSYADFDDFWQSQTPTYSPTTKMIAAMTDAERGQLIEAVRAALPLRRDGAIEYSARANAFKACRPKDGVA